jgi:hypothetical protein
MRRLGHGARGSWFEIDEPLRVQMVQRGDPRKQHVELRAFGCTGRLLEKTV